MAPRLGLALPFVENPQGALVLCILAYLTKHSHQIQNTVPTHRSSVQRATALTYESDDPSE